MKFIEEKNPKTWTGVYKVIIQDQEWNDLLEAAKKEELKSIVHPGFRKGHVPQAIAQKQVNNAKILARAHKKFIKIAYDFMNQQKNKKIKPYLTVKGFQSEIFSTKSDECVVHFSFDLMPYVNSSKWKEIKIVSKTPTVTPAELKQETVKFQENNALLELKDKKIENHDTVVIDFEGFIDNKPFEGNKAVNYSLEIGTNSMIPGFESSIIGMKPGEYRETHLTFPDNYHIPKFRNKKVKFDIFVHEVKVKKIPDLNEEFALSLNLPKVKSLKDLNDHIKTTIIQRKLNTINENNAEKILEQLFKISKVKIPPSLLEAESYMQKNNVLDKIKKDKIDFEKYLAYMKKTEEQFFSELSKEAEDRLTLSFILKSIADNENINVTNDDYNDFCKKVGAQQGISVKKVEESLFGKKEEVLLRIRNDKTWEYICKETIIIPQNSTKSSVSGKKTTKKATSGKKVVKLAKDKIIATNAKKNLKNSSSKKPASKPKATPKNKK